MEKDFFAENKYAPFIRGSQYSVVRIPSDDGFAYGVDTQKHLIIVPNKIDRRELYNVILNTARTYARDEELLVIKHEIEELTPQERIDTKVEQEVLAAA